MTLGLVAVIGVLYVQTLLDCVRTPAAQVRYVPKLLWLLFLLHAPILGALIWTYFGKRPERAGEVSSMSLA
ncbi:PLDc N-terminal domain-containing protein [Streptomyces lincolnensis]|uniref:PLDc N-terminal domain-containing protein n=1 Tax=Streptomyces lincolnensis TaxID=1915 RepID=UPI00135210A4|nr:PLDc N-terminal domain-containing protein [Streptomyces lincolnensis]